MRSANDVHLIKLRQAYLGDPADPNYSYRLNAFDLERMAQIHRAIIVGEMLADGILWLVRLPRRLAQLVRQALLRKRIARTVEGWRGAGAD